MYTSLYMLEPMERAIINCVMIVMLVTMLYSTCVYLPHYIWKLLVLAGVLSAPEGSQFLVEDLEAVLIGKSVEL
ncbi:unnamed protein product [Orchesella dallaii]|uniref:Uncharacterized protein n=1 Tax=Orchesella dallaii TaxID=48710 RepID=A0ABP1Q621_9HEXA